MKQSCIFPKCLNEDYFYAEGVPYGKAKNQSKQNKNETGVIRND